MTCEPLNPGQWLISLNEHEAVFLIHVLSHLARHYQEDVKRMPGPLRTYWEGAVAKGEITDDEGLQESQEVLAEARADLRSERLALVQNWMQEYEMAEERSPWKVEITAAERDEFIAMLNDRRMHLAFEFSVTEEDMDSDPAKIANEAKRAALWEIYYLGQFILGMIGPQIYRP